jgi:hypothetical protein
MSCIICPQQSKYFVFSMRGVLFIKFGEGKTILHITARFLNGLDNYLAEVGFSCFDYLLLHGFTRFMDFCRKILGGNHI